MSQDRHLLLKWDRHVLKFFYKCEREHLFRIGKKVVAWSQTDPQFIDSDDMKSMRKDVTRLKGDRNPNNDDKWAPKVIFQTSGREREFSDTWGPL